MQKYEAGNYDVVVVGGGHAGVEAALAAARMGQETMLITINLDKIAFMPCNPSIGGPAKGIVVREIDALGGEMGRNIDKTYIQMRLLDRKSTRLNSSHVAISYAVFCLRNKITERHT